MLYIYIYIYIYIVNKVLFYLIFHNEHGHVRMYPEYWDTWYLCNFMLCGELFLTTVFFFIQDFINRRKMTEFGNLALVEEREENEGGNATVRLPGVRNGDMASRSMKPEIRVLALQFSPTGEF